jgi:excisionase family DNA binding protein
MRPSVNCQKKRQEKQQQLEEAITQRGHMNKLLNIPQFAELLGVTQSLVRRMVLERRISIVKVGRLVRIPQTEVDRIIAEGTRPSRQGG